MQAVTGLDWLNSYVVGISSCVGYKFGSQIDVVNAYLSSGC